LGLADFNRHMQKVKEDRKQKILEKLTEQGKVKTDEVADVLKDSMTALQEQITSLLLSRHNISNPQLADFSIW